MAVYLEVLDEDPVLAEVFDHLDDLLDILVGGQIQGSDRYLTKIRTAGHERGKWTNDQKTKNDQKTIGWAHGKPTRLHVQSRAMVQGDVCSKRTHGVD